MQDCMHPKGMYLSEEAMAAFSWRYIKRHKAKGTRRKEDFVFFLTIPEALSLEPYALSP